MLSPERTSHNDHQEVKIPSAELFNQKRIGLITDIDGTISPIAPTPEEAYVTEAARQSLQILSQNMTLVAALTGRSAEYAHTMVGLDSLLYIGIHGLERWQNGRYTIAPQ